MAKFLMKWTENPEFSDWVEADKLANHARCRVCNKSFRLSNMGAGALKSHMKGPTHVANMDGKKKSSIQSFFDQNNNTKTPKPAKVATPLDAAKLAALVTKAETKWALKTVKSHYSLNSCEDLNELFPDMFEDSEIAKRFTCGPTKCGYIITFGLAPYFKEQLIDEVRKADAYAISFDESLNKIAQKSQMDFIAYFWTGDRVQSRFLGSEFTEKVKSGDLLSTFKRGTSVLDSRRLLQVSMDGPAVNLKFLRELKEARNADDEHPILLDIGTCGLHTLNGALQTGANSANWRIGRLLRALWDLLRNCPVRRREFLETGGQLFPERFCATRWLENIKPAQRAIEMWPSVVKYVESNKSKPKSKVPKCESYETVRRATQDKLTPAKLHFFLSVAMVIEPFLRKFQSDQPLIPFLASDLRLIITTLLSRFIKEDVMRTARSDVKLLEIDVENKENRVSYKKVDVGFGALQFLKDCKSERDQMEFRMECISFLAATVKKLMEKSPLKYNLVSNLVCLSPSSMLASPTDSTTLFCNVLSELLEKKWLQAHECEVINQEYRMFLHKVVHDSKSDEFAMYGKESSDRVDVFLASLLSGHDEYANLFRVIKILLTLSHGQAAVERGFSVNKEVLTENMLEESLVARRFVYDAIKSSGDDKGNYPLNKALLRSVSGARMKYHFRLQEKRDEKEKESSKKRKADVEIQEFEAKKSCLVKAIETLSDDADRIAKLAESKDLRANICRSNALRDQAKSKKKELEEIEQQIKELKER